ncbi:MAG: nuclear transport factor 2 family protein [Pseudomonadota bacterium]|nr:nuclear transport factor 2 family protein [Pseudomonadota bacterium]
MPDLRIDDLSLEQQELWRRVNDLWAMSLERSAEKIRDTLHPGYVGWDMNSPAPHGREAAIQSVLGDSPVVKDYQLRPLSIEVYDHVAGIVHYTYSATVAPKGANALLVTGKWTEIYLKQAGQWVMIGVSGRPDTPPGDSGASV